MGKYSYPYRQPPDLPVKLYPSSPQTFMKNVKNIIILISVMRFMKNVRGSAWDGPEQ
jgi:hypothetical protein